MKDSALPAMRAIRIALGRFAGQRRDYFVYSKELEPFWSESPPLMSDPSTVWPLALYVNTTTWFPT